MGGRKKHQEFNLKNTGTYFESIIRVPGLKKRNTWCSYNLDLNKDYVTQNATVDKVS